MFPRGFDPNEASRAMRMVQEMLDQNRRIYDQIAGPINSVNDLYSQLNFNAVAEAFDAMRVIVPDMNLTTAAVQDALAFMGPVVQQVNRNFEAQAQGITLPDTAEINQPETVQPSPFQQVLEEARSLTLVEKFLLAGAVSFTVIGLDLLREAGTGSDREIALLDIAFRQLAVGFGFWIAFLKLYLKRKQGGRDLD